MRRLIAIWAGKMLSMAGKLLGKKSSAGPGAIALKICPSLVKDMNKRIGKKVIVTCGTNGKTTTNNLICTALEAKGYKVLCNRIGANMLSGVATAYIESSSIFGKLNADYACLEVDEAYTPIVFKHVKPDILVVTNLFRDQLDRYGEVDSTSNLIKKAIGIAGDVKLVLNADDPLCVQFGMLENADAVYYGVSEQVMPQEESSRESKFCPMCGEELSYDYYHYSQLGIFECKKCGFKRPMPKYDIKDVSIKTPLKFTINGKNQVINQKGFYNIYNLAAVYAAIDTAGETIEDFSKLVEKYEPQIGRMQEFMFNKPVILSLSKNPAGFNQAIATVNSDERKKDVILAINDLENDGRDISWIWDVDFDKLENLVTLTATGLRLYDIGLRFKYADIRVDLITEDMKQAISKALKTDSEVVYVMVNYSAMYPTETILKELKKG